MRVIHFASCFLLFFVSVVYRSLFDFLKVNIGYVITVVVIVRS